VDKCILCKEAPPTQGFFCLPCRIKIEELRSRNPPKRLILKKRPFAGPRCRTRSSYKGKKASH